MAILKKSDIEDDEQFVFWEFLHPYRGAVVFGSAETPDTLINKVDLASENPEHQATIQKLDLEKTDITCELEVAYYDSVCIDPGVFLHKNKREQFMLRKLTALIDEQPCFVLELYHESNKFEKPIYTKVIAQVKSKLTRPDWIATWQNGKDLYFF